MIRLRGRVQMDEIRPENWGSESWNEAHFPEEQLDTDGDTWGFRWRGREKWRHDVYLKLLEDMLRKDEPQKVLDIGCALCDFTHKAWQLNTANKFYGIDISPTAVHWCQRNFPDFELKVGAIPDIPFDETFDIIFCQEVLCYLDPDGRQATLNNIRDRLKPGGIVMLTGVLDGGEKHHTTPEMLGLVRDGFEVTTIVYSHWATYRKWIEEPLDKLALKFVSMDQWVNSTEEEFASWSEEQGGSTKLKVAKGMRAIAPVSRWIVKAGTGLTRFLASRTTPAGALHAIASIRRDNEEADEIVVFATKTG